MSCHSSQEIPQNGKAHRKDRMWWNWIQLHWKRQACAEFKCAMKWTGKSDLFFNVFLPSGKLQILTAFSEFRGFRIHCLLRHSSLMYALLDAYKKDQGITKVHHNYIRFPGKNSLSWITLHEWINPFCSKEKNLITPTMKRYKIWGYINISTSQPGKSLPKKCLIKFPLWKLL